MNIFKHRSTRLVPILALILLTLGCKESEPPLISIESSDRIVLIGNNLGSRMMNYGYFESEMFSRFPGDSLVIRNMCDGASTPGFRPHSGRVSPWAFPGAEEFQTDLAQNSGSRGHFETPDEWLSRLEADVVVAMFGYSESFRGTAGLDMFKDELSAFVNHTVAQNYNGSSAPRLVLVSPIAFQDLSDLQDLPDGAMINRNLELYTQAIREVAEENSVPFLDAYQPTSEWFQSGERLTLDGSQLNDEGYRKFSNFLASKVFGGKETGISDELMAAVLEKNWFWHNDYKIPNGVHVFGRRYEPFGPANYPAELEKVRLMTSNRDSAIWAAANGGTYDLSAADALTPELPEIESNYDDGQGSSEYLYGQDALDRFEMAPGYKIELFASEKEFPDLANPVQMSFDNKGRLWVAVMPSYPHYKPGDGKPDDKLLIFEDTDGDGKADKQTIFARGLHLPTGFEFTHDGVLVAQGTNLVFIQDADGDDKADSREILLSGFDDHDSHHVISAFATDPSGAVYMGEGVFLHTNVETSYGPVRGTNGGFFRYNPARHHLERTAQLSIPNPWGIAFDHWGQNFYAETSGPNVAWMMPGSIQPKYGIGSPKSKSLIENDHRVRPTSGLEFVSSSHFPDEVQGDLLINNTIGFLGTKQHEWNDDGTGYASKHRQDLLRSSDTNFRPVDMEFAPDGSLYLVDWHNMLIGHMQHNARDPLRDHVHGRIYRVTYPSRSLVEPAQVSGADLPTLLDNLKLPEFRTRYRTRRELRGRDTDEVKAALSDWINSLDESDPRYEHHLLEALWVTWGLNSLDQDLLRRLLDAQDHKVRAAAVRVVRYMGHQLSDQRELLMKAAADPHGRVRLEALVAASWLPKEVGLDILAEVANMPLDEWMIQSHSAAIRHFNEETIDFTQEVKVESKLTGVDLQTYTTGKQIYERDGYCATCHQRDGKGLVSSGFPPLAGTDWVLQDKDRLIKITLNGLMGPITVLEKDYPGQVPMTPFKDLLNDSEIAAVLTYVRNSFGNEASVVSEADVKRVRQSTGDKKGFYSADELLRNE